MPERRITWHNGTTLLPVTWQSQHRNLAWTTHKPKNIQNRLAAFLYFLSGLVPCLFLRSHLQPLLVAEHSIPITNCFFCFPFQLSALDLQVDFFVVVCLFVFNVVQSVFLYEHMKTVPFKARSVASQHWSRFRCQPYFYQLILEVFSYNSAQVCQNQ